MRPLISYCERVMEAAWLTAIVSVPLFLNFHGERIESEKNHLFRALTIVLGTAWLIKACCQFGLKPRAPQVARIGFANLLESPLLAAVSLFATLLAVSTLLSLSPWTSFLGVKNRCLGTYSYACCLVLFAAMVATIRNEDQINRIVTLAILTSLPISLYAIGQRFSIDPINWLDGPDTSRASSTLGNPIYLGAYLVMIVPLTFSRILSYCADLQSEMNEHARKTTLLFIYALILVIELCAIALVVSRGPFVGLVIGLSAMFLMLAAYWRKRWLVLSIGGAGAALVCVLALLAWRGSSLINQRTSNEIQRFSELLDPKRGSGAERGAAWKAATQAARFTKAPHLGKQTNDAFSLRRFLFGYGPEMVAPTSRLYNLSDFNAALPNHELFDRFHSEFWDLLITTGVVGLGGYLLLTFLIIFYGLKWLGFIATAKHKHLFWFVFLGGGSVASLALVAWQGLPFLGIGVRFGTTLGLLSFLAWTGLSQQFDPSVQGIPQKQALILIALLAATIGHLNEISFAFVFETTLLHFWTFTAMLLVLEYRLNLADKANSGPPSAATTISVSRSLKSAKTLDHTNKVIPKTLRSFSSIASMCNARRGQFLAGIIIAVVGANLGIIMIQKTPATSATGIMIDGLFGLKGSNTMVSLVLPIALGSIWLGLAIALRHEISISAASRAPLRQLRLILTISGALVSLHWFLLASHTVRIIPFRVVTVETVQRFLDTRVFIVDFHYGFLFMLILLMALFLPGNQELPAAPAGSRAAPFVYLTALVAAVAAVMTIYGTDMRWSKVGIMEKLSRESFFQEMERWPITMAIHEIALRMMADAEDHSLALAKLLLDRASKEDALGQRSTLFLQADRVLETGNRLHPLNANFPIQRGNLYRKWASSETPADKKLSLAKKAIEFYDQAAVLDPGNFGLWNHRAYVELVLSGSPDDAHRSLLRSLDLQPNSYPAYGLLGSVLFHKGSATQNISQKHRLFKSALTNFQKAIVLAGTKASNETYQYIVNVGALRVNLGDTAQAILDYENALAVSPSTERWRNEEILARLYSNAKDKSNSLVHVQRAIESAPPEKTADLMKLKAQILSSP